MKKVPHPVLCCYVLTALAGMLIFNSIPVQAQLSTSLSQNWYLTYTGLHLSHTLQLSKGNFEIYAGPQIVITESPAFYKGPWGVHAGINYYTGSRDKKLCSFVNLDYSNTFYSLRLSSTGIKRRGIIQEYTIGYGLQWKIVPRFSVCNCINIGRYTELHHPGGDQKKFLNSGFNTLIKIGVCYNFK